MNSIRPSDSKFTLQTGRGVALFVILAMAVFAIGGLALGTSNSVHASGTAQGQPPHVFSGNAVIDNQPAPQGTVVSVYSGGTEIASVSVDASGRYDNLQVPTSGILVTFTVDGLPASETATTQAASLTNLDLNATRGGQNQNIPSTSTPGPTPSSIQSAFRVGPTVRLRPVSDIIDQDNDGIVEIIFRNPNLNETAMVVDLTVSLASGLHVYGEGFATDSAAGTASGTYRVPPGQSITVYLNVKADKVGRLPIQFSGAYWPEGNKDLYNPISLTHSFTVNYASPNPLSSAPTNLGQIPGEAAAAGSQPSSGSSGDSDNGDPSVSCSLSPSNSVLNGAGDGALLALPLLGLAGMMVIRGRRGS